MPGHEGPAVSVSEVQQELPVELRQLQNVGEDLVAILCALFG